CRTFAGAGATAVVVSDVDGSGAQAVADEFGDRGRVVLADVGLEPDIARLVRSTEEEFGRIELSDSVWERSWQVNVLSHVYVARAVLPGMLARGGGHLLHTASAAGLLT